MISTHTKNLQSQLFDMDLPFLRKHLGVDFTAAQREIHLRKRAHTGKAFGGFAQAKKRNVGV